MPHCQPKKKKGSTIYSIQRVSNHTSHSTLLQQIVASPWIFSSHLQKN
jgi:hypothetical protein